MGYMTPDERAAEARRLTIEALYEASADGVIRYDEGRRAVRLRDRGWERSIRSRCADAAGWLDGSVEVESGGMMGAAISAVLTMRVAAYAHCGEHRSALEYLLARVERVATDRAIAFADTAATLSADAAKLLADDGYDVGDACSIVERTRELYS